MRKIIFPQLIKGKNFAQKLKFSNKNNMVYSRVHNRWNEVFFKILKKPSIVQNKKLPHMKAFCPCIDIFFLKNPITKNKKTKN